MRRELWSGRLVRLPPEWRKLPAEKDDTGKSRSLPWQNSQGFYSCERITVYPQGNTSMKWFLGIMALHLLGPDNLSTIGRFEYLPVALDVPLFEYIHDLLCDLLEVACGKR